MTKKDDNTINLSDKKVKFWTDQINEETVEKKRDLERELEKKVDENIDSKVSSFMKNSHLNLTRFSAKNINKFFYETIKK